MLRPEHLLQLHDTPITADPPIPSRDPTWPTSTRYTPLIMAIQEDQYMTDLPETHQAAREAE